MSGVSCYAGQTRAIFAISSVRHTICEHQESKAGLHLRPIDCTLPCRPGAYLSRRVDGATGSSSRFLPVTAMIGVGGNVQGMKQREECRDVFYQRS
jgi:hypothetical protein